MVTVMDMVIFRTIFFELFSFLHVHAPYHPFRLLTNLGMHQRQGKDTSICTADDDSTQKHEHVILLLIVRGPRRRLLLHCILHCRRKSRHDHRGYHPGLVLYDLLSHQQLLLLRRTRSPMNLHPLEIPPTNLEEIGGAIRSSSHIAELAEKDGGLGHAPADMMQE